jgi:hypothetical protein
LREGTVLLGTLRCALLPLSYVIACQEVVHLDSSLLLAHRSSRCPCRLRASLIKALYR